MPSIELEPSFRRPVSIALLAMLAVSIAPAQFIWINPLGGGTATAANWSTGIPPTGTSGSQDVHIHSLAFPTALAPLNMPITINNWIVCNRLFVRGNVTASSPGYISVGSGTSTVAGNFTVQSSTVEGSGNYQIDGLTTLTGGTLGGTGVWFANGGVRINPSSSFAIRRPVDANGTSTWESGTVYNADLRPFRNLGTLTIANGNEWWDTPWTNLGTLIKSGTNESKFQSGSFANAGTLTALSGSLNIGVSNSGGHSGRFDIRPGASLRMRGNSSYNSTSRTEGDGRLIVDSGTGSWQAGATIGDVEIEIANGTANFFAGVAASGQPKLFPNNGSVNHFEPALVIESVSGNGAFHSQSGTQVSGPFNFSGTIQGPGPITVSGVTTYTSGQMLTGGRFNAAGGLHLTGSGTKDLRKEIVQSGNSSWSGGLVFSSGSLTNLGNWAVSVDAEWGSTGAILNPGVISRDTGGGTVRFTQAGFQNSGTVNANSGTLRFDTNPTAHTGIFNIGPNGTLQLTNGASFGAGARIQGTGNFRGVSNAYNFNSGSVLSGVDVTLESSQLNLLTGSQVQNSPSLLLNSGTINVSNGQPTTLGSISGTGTIQTNTPATVSGNVSLGGNVSGSADLTVVGSTTYRNGQMLSGGRLIAQGGLNLSTNVAKDIRRDIIQSGASTWSGGAIFSTGAFQNLGTWAISVDADWGSTGSVQNSGVLSRDTGAGSVRFAQAPFQNSGTVNANSGTLRFDANSAPHTGTFNVGANGTLQLTNGASFGAGSRLQGTGLFRGVFSTYNFQSGSTLSDVNIELENSQLTLSNGSQILGTPDFVLNSGTIQSSTGSTANLGSVTGTGLLRAESPVVVNGPLNLSGTIAGAGTLTVTGLMTFAAGQIQPGGTLTTQGGLALTTGAIKDFQRSLSFGGTTNWTGGSVFGNNASYSNSGTFNMAGDLSWAGGAIWTNAGSINKTLGSGVGSFSNLTTWSNQGTVNVSSGTLEFNASGAHTGRFNTNSGTLLVLSGSQTFSGTARLQGNGITHLTNGTATFQSAAHVSGNIQANNATLNFNSGVVISSPVQLSIASSSANFNTGSSLMMNELLVNNGYATVNDPMSVSGHTQFLGGRFSGSGPLAFNGGLSLGGSTVKSFDLGFSMASDSFWTGGSVALAAGKIVQSHGNFTISDGSLWTGGIFNNLGTLVKTGGQTTQVAYPNPQETFGGAQFSNSGQVQVQGGTLQVGGWGSHDGDFSVSSGATLAMNAPGEFRSGSQVTGLGTVRFEGGVTNFQSGSSFTADLAMDSGTLNFNEGSSVTLPTNLNRLNGGILNLSTGGQKNLTDLLLKSSTITGTDDLRVSQAFTFQGGTLTGAGRLIMPASSTVLLTTGSNKNISRVVDNAGTATFAQGLVLGSGGTWNNSGTTLVAGDLNWLLGTFNNSGTLEKSAGTGNATVSPNILTNTGLIRANSGSLTLVNLSNLNRTTRRLTGGVYESCGDCVLKFNDISGGLSENFAHLRISGPAGSLRDSSGQPLLRSLQLNAGIITLEGGAELTLPHSLVNTGTLNVVDGSISLAGSLDINAGVVTVEGELSTPSVDVNAGSLKGSGLVDSTLINNAELNPGVGVGQLGLNGSFTQGSQGQLKIEIDGILASNSDRLQINGPATLNGSLVIDAPGELFIPPTTRYRVLETSGSLTGAFSSVPPSNIWNVIYGPNFVEVERVGSGPVATVSGRVVLSQFNPALGMRPVTLMIRDGDSVLESAVVFPASNGTWNYSFQTGRQGSYTLSAIADGFLRQSQPISIVGSSVTGMNFTLVNGDVDNSGEVDAADIDAVISRFGAVSGDVGYIPAADPDNSHEIDAADIDIVISNFGSVGN